MDAEFLARQGRADPSLLHPIRHRGPDAQAHLALLRSRDQLVRARTKLIDHVRGSVKSLGGRIPKGGAEAFPRRAAQAMPQELKLAMEPLLEMVTELTQRIRAMDHRIQKVIEAQYPEARRLQRIPGVGPVTSLAFVLLIEDPYRFERSRRVGIVPDERIESLARARLLCIQPAAYRGPRQSDNCRIRPGRAWPALWNQTLAQVALDSVSTIALCTPRSPEQKGAVKNP